MLVQPLTAPEQGRLVELERVVDTGLGTFVEVGLALKEIRDSRLYRTQHATFENYCQQRWRFTRTHGHRLIVAAEVAGDLLPIGNKLLTCEAQVRELAPLSAERRREVWLQVTASGYVPPTAKRIREAILEQRVPRKPAAVKVTTLVHRLYAMFQEACYMVTEPEQLASIEEALAWMTGTSPGYASTLPIADPRPKPHPSPPRKAPGRVRDWASAGRQ